MYWFDEMVFVCFLVDVGYIVVLWYSVYVMVVIGLEDYIKVIIKVNFLLIGILNVVVFLNWVGLYLGVIVLYVFGDVVGDVYIYVNVVKLC